MGTRWDYGGNAGKNPLQVTFPPRLVVGNDVGMGWESPVFFSLLTWNLRTGLVTLGWPQDQPLGLAQL
jgi:hypothetical protein